ncbi:hypothetical protein E4T80_07115 [Muribacter muris]|uniref:HNH nuclease domain-containing protein n=2 Tax=Muribacter muris TaxID=67855 RepID=A0A4Y9JZW4_9PAST|nr:hypothetical protein [Muribacter muris]TFV10057.1 hypothetical protein E4T80_07115 [Muribacter muris]
MKKISDELIESALQSKILQADGCWLWNGSFSRGSPMHTFRIDGERVSISPRRYYAEQVGLMNNKEIYTTCGNEHCVNPLHLKAGHHINNRKTVKIARVIHAYKKAKSDKADYGTQLVNHIATEHGIAVSTLYGYIKLYKDNPKFWEEIWQKLSLPTTGLEGLATSRPEIEKRIIIEKQKREIAELQRQLIEKQRAIEAEQRCRQEEWEAEQRRQKEAEKKRLAEEQEIQRKRQQAILDRQAYEKRLIIEKKQKEEAEKERIRLQEQEIQRKRQEAILARQERERVEKERIRLQELEKVKQQEIAELERLKKIEIDNIYKIRNTPKFIFGTILEAIILMIILVSGFGVITSRGDENILLGLFLIIFSTWWFFYSKNRIKQEEKYLIDNINREFNMKISKVKEK